MVKFSHQLEGSLVPEWKDAYCNYKALKRIVNRIKQDRLSSTIHRNGSTGAGLMKSLGSMTTLHNLGTHLKPSASSFSVSRTQSGEVIVVHNNESSWMDDHGFDQSGVELIEPLGHAEQDKIFFNRLDAELQKIDKFYQVKEAEYVAQATRLEQQLIAMFEVREALTRQNLKMQTLSNVKDRDNSSEDESDGGSSTCQNTPLLQIVTVKSYQPNEPNEASTATEEESTISSSDEEMGIIANFIENVEVTDEPEATSPGTHSRPQKTTSSPSFRKSLSAREREKRSQKPRNGSDTYPLSGHHPDVRPSSSVKSKVEFESQRHRERSQGRLHRPKSIIQDMIDMSLRKKKIQSSERMLRKAFIEFYRGLGLLKSYSSLNLVAFAKIMKKYDKVVKQKLGPLYIQEVERSYFASSDKVTKLMVRVEDIFTKHFAQHDRRKAMAQLRPMQHHGSHMTTFFLGIFSGSSMALLVGFLVLLCTSVKYRTVGGHEYMDTVFRVFSTLGLVLLHMYMYGWNLYAWQQTRINYPFIFEFAPGTELRYREVLLVCTGFTSLLLGTMIAHIVLSSMEIPLYYTSEYAPMAVALVFLVSLIAPVNILYRSSRAFFLRCMQHIIFSPLYKVVLADFFLADQLTSQVASFRNMEFMVCYYSGGYFQTRDQNACTNNSAFKDLMYVFSLLPYWFRLLQCLRRWRDEGDKHQLYNGGKYASAMLAVFTRLKYGQAGNAIWLALFIICSIFATLYQLYWDLVVDWGLLQRKSKNRWLRDNLILKKKYLYFVSMALNVILRLAWISSIQRIDVFATGLSQNGWDTIFASLEVIRRGHWNFYRLENEHLNNVGKYRAVKTVPLPFEVYEGATV